MPLRVFALFCITLVRGDGPTITSASWATFAWSSLNPCPPAYEVLFPGGCTVDQATRVILTGSGFDAAPGTLGGVDAAYFPPPVPAPVPADLPSVLLLSELAPFSTNGCLPPSDAANADYSIEVCPFGTSYLRARGGGVRVASLGAFSGVTSNTSVECLNETISNPQPLPAATGFRYSGGDVCGSGVYSAQVNFTCISSADPWQNRYLRNATVNAASVSSDGCTWVATIPLSSACPGDDFELCEPSLPPFPPAPTPLPQPQYQTVAYVEAWAPGAISVLRPAGQPNAVRVRNSSGAVSAPRAPVAAPLPPSASPIPLPFPAQLTVLQAAPSSALSSDDPANSTALPCTPVTISLGGVLPSDLTGVDASFEIVFPRTPTFNDQPKPLYGAPAGVGGAPGIPALNGRLDLQLDCAPKLLQGFGAWPATANFSLRSRFRPAPGSAFVTGRQAVCSGGQACLWTFLGPNPPSPQPSQLPSPQASPPPPQPSLSPSPSPQPSPPPPAAAPAAPAGLSPASLYGIIGAGSAVALAGIAAVLYFFVCAGGKAAAAGAGAGAAGAGAQPGAVVQAWGASSVVSLNPVAAGAAAAAAAPAAPAFAAGGGSLSGVQPGVPEWGVKQQAV